MFRTNPEKAASRVAINGVMLASLFVMLAVVFLEPEKFHYLAIVQMVLSVPFLFVSSLAYSKIGYWDEVAGWSIFGYVTLTFGNMFTINAVGLLASSISISLSYTYFVLIISLLLVYSVLNVSTHKTHVSFRRQSFKFFMSLMIIIFGGLIPLLL